MGKVYCEACNKRCRGNALRVIDKYYHKECFRCKECKCSLESIGFFMKDNNYYCEKDYKEILVLKCKVCLKQLSGKVVSALSYSFHKDCFICHHCKTSFEPGHRVTVLGEHFFCATCSQNLTASKIKNQQRSSLSFADKITSSITTDDEGCASAANASSTNELTSPRISSDFDKQPTGQKPSNDLVLKTAEINEKPKLLKSSLRKSKGLPELQPPDPGYISSADSGIGDRVFPVKPLVNGVSTLPITSNCQNQNHLNLCNSLSMSKNQTPTHFSPNRYSSNNPLFEYGMGYNSSFITLTDNRFRRSTDQYRRNGQTPLVNSSTIPFQHFHIPQTNLRASLPANRVHQNEKSGSMYEAPLLNGHASGKEAYCRQDLHANKYKIGINHSGLSKTQMSNTNCKMNSRNSHLSEYSSYNGLIANSTPQLTGGSSFHSNEIPISSTLPNGLADANQVDGNTTYRSDREASLEARRLAGYPSGQPRDTSKPPAIDRFDWPAPASSAVVLAELMREHRQRLRETGNRLDTDSQEDLSIDASVESHSETAVSSGLERAINFEEDEKHRQSRSVLDPISSSRTPNARLEPPFKTRYSTHTFASPSRESDRVSTSPHRLGYSLEFINLGNRNWTGEKSLNLRNGVRPGYTAGHLSTITTLMGTPGISNLIEEEISSNNLDSFPVNGCSNEQLFSNNGGKLDGAQFSDFSPSRTVDQFSRINGSGDTSSRYSNQHITSNPSLYFVSNSNVIFKKLPPPPVKEFTYDELLHAIEDLPRSLDRTKLETYLSASEFEKVFRFKRCAFYRLPEWKQNDLKRRVRLF